MLAVFIVGFFWFTHGNGFPSFYHPEEEIRASQLIKGDWDLHRPLLSAVTTKLLKMVLHVPDDLRLSFSLAERSPHSSPSDRSSASVSPFTFSLIPRRRLCFPFLLLCQHQFFDLAHTMSENSSLMFGASADATGHCASRTKSHGVQSLAARIQRGDCCFG